MNGEPMGTGPASEPSADVEHPAAARKSLRQRSPASRVASGINEYAGGFTISEHVLRRIVAWAGARLTDDKPEAYATERTGRGAVSDGTLRCARCHRRLQTVYRVGGRPYGRTCAKREGERSA